MKRVLVIGCCGAGKSTFSRKLREITGLPLYPLDRYYWKPNWVEPDKSEWERVVTRLIARDEWIIDGNYSGTLEMRINRSDTVIWLDFPRLLCLLRALKRIAFSGRNERPDMADGCEERFELEFLQYVWNFRRDKGPKLEGLFGGLPSHVKKERFTSPAEQAQFLKQLSKQRFGTKTANDIR